MKLAGRFLLFAALFALVSMIACAGDDDDDDELDETDDGDDDDNPPDDTCDFPAVRQNIEWLFESCYSILDAQDDPVTADDVCDLSANAIGCYNGCADDAEECGGDEDPLLECMIDCGLEDLSA